MRKTASLLALVAVAGLMMLTAPDQADARPQYLKGFKKKYEDLAEKAKDCGVCHGGEKGKNKKQLSDYAMVLKEAIGKKNEKGEKKIDEAFDKAAEEEYDDNRTYGDLIEDGKLPPPHKEKDE